MESVEHGSRVRVPRVHRGRARFAAEFEPPSGSPLGRTAQDVAIDLLFSGQPNDLVVPTFGVATVQGRDLLAADLLLLGPEIGVEHGSFFGHPKVTEQLLAWLPGRA